MMVFSVEKEKLNKNSSQKNLIDINKSVPASLNQMAAVKSNENLSPIRKIESESSIQTNDSNESKNSPSANVVLNSNDDSRSGLLSKCSSRCLIIFGLFCITILVVCCILMGIFTASYLMKANRMNKYFDQLENRTLSEAEYLDGGGGGGGRNKNKQLERNAFNWIKDTIRKTLFGFTDDEDQKKAIKNDFKNSKDYFSKPPVYFSECGKPTIMPSIINTRIMNGKEAVRSSWPFAVSIGLDGPRDYVPHACGGTLLNKRYVITAAHCVSKTSVFNLVGQPNQNIDKYKSIESMIKIYVGVHDRLNDIKPYKIYNVESIISHSGFDSFTFKNDLALIKLDRDVEQTDQIGFACITKSTQVVPGDTIYAIGWGFSENSRNKASRYLMQVDLTVQRKDTCLIQYIDQDQFCAGNIYKKKDTCNGDSGGPLLQLYNQRWTLMGVVSNGDASCSGTGIYTNVPFFYDWIVSNINV